MKSAAVLFAGCLESVEFLSGRGFNGAAVAQVHNVLRFGACEQLFQYLEMCRVKETWHVEEQWEGGVA